MNKIIKKNGKAKLKVKRSEFLAYSLCINDQNDISEFLKNLKSKHPTARHFCWAYRIIKNDQVVENYSDAGEPSGSAGIPILNALKSNQIINCAIVVVRNFGGVKLGKRGLIDAYQKVAGMAITESDIQIWEPKIVLNISADIDYYGNISGIVKIFKGSIISDRSGNNVELIVKIPAKAYINFRESFAEATQKSGKIKKQSEHDQTKEVRK